jgi:hypothetical protein
LARPHVLLDPANFWLWLAPAVLISIAGSIGGELIKQPENVQLWLWLALLLGAVAVMGLLFSRKVQRMIEGQRRHAEIQILKDVTRAKALIVFVSKGEGSSSALEAALYHAREDVLRELWMITSAEAEEEAKRVGEAVRSRFPAVTIPPPVRVADIYSIPDAKAEVEKIRTICLRKYKREADVMCDFTGFTKSMSAGMILACAPKSARLQYMHPNEFLPNGRANTAAGSHPVEVEIAYSIEEEEEG